MKNLYLNPDTGDIEFDGQNNFKFVEDLEEEEQSFRILLDTNTGEWFLNTLHGLAYQYLQGKNISETRVRAELLKALEQHESFEELLDFNFDFDRSRRELKLYYKIKMKSGNIVEGEVST